MSGLIVVVYLVLLVLVLLYQCIAFI
jgi:hypothetical protein